MLMDSSRDVTQQPCDQAEASAASRSVNRISGLQKAFNALSQCCDVVGEAVAAVELGHYACAPLADIAQRVSDDLGSDFLTSAAFDNELRERKETRLDAWYSLKCAHLLCAGGSLSAIFSAAKAQIRMTQADLSVAILLLARSFADAACEPYKAMEIKDHYTSARGSLEGEFIKGSLKHRVGGAKQLIEVLRSAYSAMS